MNLARHRRLVGRRVGQVEPILWAALYPQVNDVLSICFLLSHSGLLPHT